MGYWSQDHPDELWLKADSVLAGKRDWARVDDDDPVRSTGVVRAFMEDNDLVSMTIVSACIGFVYEFQKRRDKEAAEQPSTSPAQAK